MLYWASKAGSQLICNVSFGEISRLVINQLPAAARRLGSLIPETIRTMNRYMPEQLGRKPTTTRNSLLSMIRDYFFTQRYCLACAQWASGCRELNRQAAIHELRIEEARDYLDLFQCVFEKLTKISEALAAKKRSNSSARLLQETASLMGLAEKNDFRLHALNDHVLRDLHEQLRLIVREERSNVLELISRVGKPSNDGIEAVAGGLLVKGKSAAMLLHRMQERLDELAHTQLMKCPERGLTL